MGAWGAGPFENDESADFIGDLSESGPDLELLDGILAADYIEVDSGEILLAAAAIVASTRGGSPVPAHLNVDASAFVLQLGDERIESLRRQLERVTGGPEESELYAVWEEAGSLDEWLVPAKDIVARLG